MENELYHLVGEKKILPQISRFTLTHFLTLILLRLLGYYTQAVSEENTFGSRYMVIPHEMTTQGALGYALCQMAVKFGHLRAAWTPMNESQRALCLGCL